MKSYAVFQRKIHFVYWVHNLKDNVDCYVLWKSVFYNYTVLLQKISLLPTWRVFFGLNPPPSGIVFFFQFWHLRPPPLQNFQWPCGVGVWKFFGTTHWLKNVWLTNQNLLNLPIVCLLYPASNNILRLTQMFLLPFSDIWKVDEARFWFYLRWQHKELQILDASFFQLFMLFIIGLLFEEANDWKTFLAKLTLFRSFSLFLRLLLSLNIRSFLFGYCIRFAFGILYSLVHTKI